MWSKGKTECEEKTEKKEYQGRTFKVMSSCEISTAPLTLEPLMAGLFPPSFCEIGYLHRCYSFPYRSLRRWSTSFLDDPLPSAVVVPSHKVYIVVQRGIVNHRHLLARRENQISYKRIKISVLRLISHEVTVSRTWDVTEIAVAGGRDITWLSRMDYKTLSETSRILSLEI